MFLCNTSISYVCLKQFPALPLILLKSVHHFPRLIQPPPWWTCSYTHVMSFSACVSEAPSPDVFSFFISFCHGSSTSSQLCKETTNTGFKELFRTFETIRMDMVAQIMKVGVGGSCRRDLLKCKWGQVNQTCIQVGVSKYFIKHRDYSSRFPRLSFMLHLLLLRDRLQLFHGPTLRC